MMSAKLYGFTARIIISAVFTAFLLSLCTMDPCSAKRLSGERFLLVIESSTGRLNSLWINPSAIDAPRLPPPMIAIFFDINIYLIKMPHRFYWCGKQQYTNISNIFCLKGNSLRRSQHLLPTNRSLLYNQLCGVYSYLLL